MWQLDNLSIKESKVKKSPAALMTALAYYHIDKLADWLPVFSR